MNYKFSLWQKILRALLYLQSWLRLQHVANALQRTLKGEWWKPKMDLPVFKTPQEIQEYMEQRYEWRPDQLIVGGKRIGLDYISNPRLVQAKLDMGTIGDGDCDDIHGWYAACLRKIPHSGMRPTGVYTMSVVWKGGGHTVAVYTNGTLCYLVDYDIYFVGSTDKTKWLVNQILDRYADGAPLRFFVFQDEKLRVVAANEKFL